MSDHFNTASETVAEQLKTFTEVQRQLQQTRLTAAQSPADRALVLEQKRAKLSLSSIKDEIALTGTLAQIAKEIDLATCVLDTSELRGALLTIMDNASDIAAVAAFRTRDEKFKADKRPVKFGVRAFLAVAHPSAELIEQTKALRFREDRLAGGFGGRADLDTLVTLGRDFNCTVRVKSGKDTIDLVRDGTVDEATLKMLASQYVTENPTTPPSAEATGSKNMAAESGLLNRDAIDGASAPEEAEKRVSFNLSKQHGSRSPGRHGMANAAASMSRSLPGKQHEKTDDTA
ncbi:hypothetical protein KD146_07470 [Devosia sp. BSSL-BM10]|uniref:Uncharacterized protein n=1 Tax=Devosia litorisediminis TaxID=2829817 RepID=A0A942EC03_9HYPH|nr:hypothetical protein [Devosia litorisediminis]MBS3848539.1 hypothetical protein [Devosia litorisediminis]